ncbi:MAG TPA: hypothetical protein VGH66_00160 [Acidimicrobiales bacterium]|jgi:hypothetical protein
MDVRRLFPWLLRVVWVILPFTVGPALGAAVHPHSEPVRLAAAILAWAVWSVVLVSTLVPLPVGLTALRVISPAVAAVAIGAALTNRPSATEATLAVLSALAALVVAMAPATGVLYVNGPAYPNERRYPLRIPGPLLFGPLELAWALTVGPLTVGVLLVAARAWIAGGIVLGAGLPVSYVLAQALHRLSHRWVVFVPAGLVLSDPLTLAEPVLFLRELVETLRPAAADSDSLDLTQRAYGLALELVLWEKVPLVVVKPGQTGGQSGSSARLLFTPTRPGKVMAEAGARRIPVG